MLIQTLLLWEHVGFKGSIQQLWLLRNFWRDMNHHSQNKIEDMWDFFYVSRFLPIFIFALIYCICFSVCFLSDSTWSHSDRFLLLLLLYQTIWFPCIQQIPLENKQADKQKVYKITQTIFLLYNPKWNQCFPILPSSIAINELYIVFWGWRFDFFFLIEINISIFAAIIWTKVLFCITNISVLQW